MKKLFLCALLAALAIVSAAQTTPVTGSVEGVGVRGFVGAPTGSCTSLQTAVNVSNGQFYTCNGGSWAAVGGSGSGTVSANSGNAGALAFYSAAGGSTTVGPEGNITDSSGTLTFTAGATHITSNQGTLGAGGVFTSAPFINHSVTWNTTSQIDDDDRAITCTAAGANSSAFKLSVGGNPFLNFQFVGAGCTNPQLGFANSATTTLAIKPGTGYLAGSAQVLQWSSTTAASGTADTCLDRQAAKVLRVDGNSACNDGLGTLQYGALKSTNACASSGGTCSAAPNGFVSIAAAATTVTVSTTAVTANSQILITEDSTLGTALSVTCNTTTGRTYSVTTRTAGTSFVITASAAPATNPACLSYTIVN